MRRFGLFVLIAVVEMLTALPPAAAQQARDHESEGGVRGFHGTRPLGGIKRSFASDDEARAEIERITSSIGLFSIADRVTLRQTADTPNAEAYIGKSGERLIMYNAVFMQKLKEKTAEHWSMVSILAHEIGHHVLFHTEIEGRNHEFELEADYFSGFVLRRLGATVDQTQAAMKLISPKEASLTHPARDQRLHVITIGWTDAGSGGTPRGLRELFKSVPVLQASGPDTEAMKERDAATPNKADSPALAQSTLGRFKGTLQFEPLDDGVNIKLVAPFGFIDAKGRSWDVPAGAVPMALRSRGRFGSRIRPSRANTGRPPSFTTITAASSPAAGRTPTTSSTRPCLLQARNRAPPR